MSIFTILGAGPSNFTVPFTDAEASAEAAQPAIIPTDADKATKVHPEISADLNLMTCPSMVETSKNSHFAVGSTFNLACVLWALRERM
jgi:hypothetical protein